MKTLAKIVLQTVDWVSRVSSIFTPELFDGSLDAGRMRALSAFRPSSSESQKPIPSGAMTKPRVCRCVGVGV